jgi:Primase C terminal 2 (PriCT-2)
MKADVRLIRTTFFRNKSAAKLTAGDMSLEELRELILGTNAATKDKLPWLKFATFGDNKSDKGSLCHDANIISISGIEADYDGEEISFEEAVAFIKRHHLLALIYTSPSYTREKPRWRVLCPTSRDLPPEERAKLLARLNGIFGGVFAPESFTLSQSYYYGSVNNNVEHRAAIVEGDCIDLRCDLDNGAIGNVFKSDDHTPNEKLVADDLEELKAAVDAIPNDLNDYYSWKKLGMAIYSATEGDGFEIFDRFSQRWIGGEYNEARTRKAWNQIDRSPPNQSAPERSTTWPTKHRRDGGNSMRWKRWRRSSAYGQNNRRRTRRRHFRKRHWLCVLPKTTPLSYVTSQPGTSGCASMASDGCSTKRAKLGRLLANYAERSRAE